MHKEQQTVIQEFQQNCLVVVNSQGKVLNVCDLENTLILDGVDAPGIEASSPELGCVSTGPSTDPENNWAPEVSQLTPNIIAT